MNTTTIILLIIAALLLVDITYTLFSLYKATNIIPPTLTNDENPEVVFVGDSVARGFGATKEDTSVYGRTKQYLNKPMANKAKNGFRMKDLINQTSNEFTIAIIGSNDLFRFTKITDFENHTKIVFKQLANNAIVIGPGRVQEVSATPLLLKPLYKYRAKHYEKIMQEQANIYNITYISPQQDHNVGPYENMEANDNFHPNNEGHRYWFDLVKLALEKHPEKSVSLPGS